VLVQHGLFANEQGELFRIDITGVTQEAVQLYAEKVRVCLDYIFTEEVASSEAYSAEKSIGQPSVPFGANSEDVSIEIYLLGFFDPQKVPADEIIKPLLEAPVEKWLPILKEQGLTPDQARPGESKQIYVIDFTIDPAVKNAGTHHYPERSATKVWVDVSVKYGNGSVKAALCRNSALLASVAVTKGGAQESGSMSDQRNQSSTYDLGVKGNANGSYRVSGRWGWGGWSAAYLDPAPAGSLANCNP
jgi:hypothetical protein